MADTNGNGGSNSVSIVAILAILLILLAAGFFAYKSGLLNNKPAENKVNINVSTP